MKNLLLLACLLAGITIANAQHNSRSFHFGVHAQALLNNTDGDQLQPGTGQHLQAWVRYAFAQDKGIELSTGYRQLGNYGQKYIRYEERNYPTEYQFEVESRQLSALNYLDASLSYYSSLGKSSRWSTSAGLRFAKLQNVKGEQYSGIYQYSSYYDRITENQTSGGSTSSPTNIEAKALDKKDFADYDIGLHAALFYRITSGLQVKAAIYQGLVPVFDEAAFPDEGKYFISSLSLGFSAQIW